MRPWSRDVPVVGVSAFVVLYALAAGLYPGGTKYDRARVGFSAVDNYWCDLLDEPTYGGLHNPGRPVALAATIVLCAALAVFWWRVPALYPDSPRRAVVVRTAGLASGVITPLIATRFHDRAIDAAGFLGLVAFVATVSALGTRGGKKLAALSGAVLALSVVNYGIWRTGFGIRALPAIQKAAFASFLSWVVVVSKR